jgi:hypothetical protein
MSTISRVIASKKRARGVSRPSPGNISSSFVYSWFTTRSPCRLEPSIGRKPT